MIFWYLKIGSRSLDLSVWEWDPVYCAPAYTMFGLVARRGGSARYGIQFTGRKTYDTGCVRVGMAWWWIGRGHELSVTGPLIRVNFT
jgi:hypothetical protein